MGILVSIAPRRNTTRNMVKKNCPNCGAVYEDNRITCSYCGTMYLDVPNLEIGKEVYIRLKHNGKLVIAKCITNNIDFETHSDTVTARSFDGKLQSVVVNNGIGITMQFEAIPQEDGSLVKVFER